MVSPVEQLPGWDSLAQPLRRRFLGAGLPASVLDTGDHTAIFTLGPELTEATVLGLGTVLCFGQGLGAFDGDFCLDLATHAVYLVTPENLPAFVNSTLESFASTMRMVVHDESAITAGDADDCAAAAERIRETLEQVDLAAAETDTYWDAILYDFAAGNYSDNPDF